MNWYWARFSILLLTLVHCLRSLSWLRDLPREMFRYNVWEGMRKTLFSFHYYWQRKKNIFIMQWNFYCSTALRKQLYTWHEWTYIIQYAQQRKKMTKKIKIRSKEKGTEKESSSSLEPILVWALYFFSSFFIH